MDDLEKQIFQDYPAELQLLNITITSLHIKHFLLGPIDPEIALVGTKKYQNAFVRAFNEALKIRVTLTFCSLSISNASRFFRGTLYIKVASVLPKFGNAFVSALITAEKSLRNANFSSPSILRSTYFLGALCS